MEKERKKTEQQESRSARAAQRRKELRKENARLQRLREKQQRQAKRRTVKKISKGVYKRLLIMGGVVLAVVLSMIIFFRVQTIQIEGMSFYSEEEIRSVAGVVEGDNLLTLSRSKISGSIMKQLRLVETVKVSRQLPNTLIIRVVESEPRYAICDVEGNYHLITAEAKVVEPISASEAGDYIQIMDMVIAVPTAGQELQVHAETGEETRARGQLDALKSLLTELEKAELTRAVASVHIPSSFKLSLWYEDRFEVQLGDTERLDYKLAYMQEVISKEKSHVTGKIDVTLTDGDRAFLSRDE